MNGRAETHSLVVYLSAKGLSRSFSFTSKVRIKRPETGELFRVGDRSMSQERRRWRDRLSDDRNAQDLFKGLLGKCND
jgi:hypothetical protein